MKKNKQIRVVGKGLTEQEIKILVFFVEFKLRKQIVCLALRHSILRS